MVNDINPSSSFKNPPSIKQVEPAGNAMLGTPVEVGKSRNKRRCRDWREARVLNIEIYSRREMAHSSGMSGPLPNFPSDILSRLSHLYKGLRGTPDINGSYFRKEPPGGPSGSGK